MTIRANTFVDQVIAVLSRRASAFEPDPAEPQTFPGHINSILFRRGPTGNAGHSTDASQTLADRELHTHTEQVPDPRAGELPQRAAFDISHPPREEQLTLDRVNVAPDANEAHRNATIKSLMQAEKEAEIIVAKFAAAAASFGWVPASSPVYVNATLVKAIADAFGVEDYSTKQVIAAIGKRFRGKAVAVEFLGFFGFFPPGRLIASHARSAMTATVGALIIQYMKEKSPYV